MQTISIPDGQAVEHQDMVPTYMLVTWLVKCTRLSIAIRVVLHPVSQAKAAGGAAGIGSPVPRGGGASGRLAERHGKTAEYGRAHGHPDLQDHPADHPPQGTVPTKLGSRVQLGIEMDPPRQKQEL